MVKDPDKFSQAMFIMSNPDHYTKMVYDQAVADTLEDRERTAKNITMDQRQKPQANNSTANGLYIDRSSDGASSWKDTGRLQVQLPRKRK